MARKKQHRTTERHPSHEISVDLPSPSGEPGRVRGKMDEFEENSDKRWRVPRKPYEQGGAADDDVDETLRELEEKREQLGDFEVRYESANQ